MTIADALAAADWDIPPAEMEFAAPYAKLIQEVADLVASLAPAPLPEPIEPPSWQDKLAAATSLYLKAPGIVNVMLNYKICVEHGLPLHPTVYYELKEAGKYRINHDLAEIDRANRLYRRSIDLARNALRLDGEFAEQARSFLNALPAELRGFIYTGIRDRYTWRGSEPALLRRLAGQVSSEFKPDLIVAAAHGSIMPGLLLSELLGLPLYFIRFSMFKRSDEEPIVSFSDQAWLFSYQGRKALLYDEDVAGGRTLELFTRKMAPLFRETRTACSIRHAGASIKPDFCAKIWWE
jgi:hypothetical protein